MHTDDDGADVGRAALRKASWRILPLIALCYGVSYMDRVNISFAALQMNRDLGFTATMYGLGGGLFFLTYALLEVPSNLLLVRFGARRWIARILLTWGVLATCMMLVRTPMQFYVMRLLVGAAEAGFFPGVVFFLMHWFPASYRSRVISRFYVAIPLSAVVMGGLAGSILGLDGRLGLRGWQWLFLIEGLPAVVLSAVVLLCLPDAPAGAKWLTAPQRDWIVAKLAEDAAAVAREAKIGTLALLRDPRLLGFTLAQFCVIAQNYAFNLSAPAILRAQTHLSIANVGYLIAAGGLVGAVSMLVIAWSSDRAQERHLHVAIPLLAAAVGAAVISVGPPPLVVMVAYVVWVAGSLGTQATLWAIPGSFLQGRAAALGVAAAGGCSMLGAFIGPWAWGVSVDRTGGIHLGLLALVALLVLAAAVFIVQRPTRRLAPAAARAAVSAV